MFRDCCSREIGSLSQAGIGRPITLTQSASGSTTHAAVVITVPFEVWQLAIIVWRQSGRDIAHVTGLMLRHARHVVGGLGVIFITVPGEVNLRAANVAVEVAVQVER